MPGLVVDVLVAPGEMVQEGDVLLVQESMKMQMQLRASCAGRVAALRVCAGDQVEKGAVLAQVDPAS
jgi:biotin carboxyl carrier protein